MLRWVPARGAIDLLSLTVIFYWKVLFATEAIFPWGRAMA